MHFGEYELFPSLIGLSPLPSAHPKTFQRQLVRPSIWFHPDFSLAKGRSQGFASAPTDSGALFRLAFASAPRLSTLNLASEEQLVGSLCKRHAVTHYCAPTACKRTVSGTVSLRCSRCFSPFPHGTGPLSVSQEYLALPDGPGRFTQDSTCPALLRIPTSRVCLHVRGCHPLWRRFPALFRFTYPRLRRSYNPGRA